MAEIRHFDHFFNLCLEVFNLPFYPTPQAIIAKNSCFLDVFSLTIFTYYSHQITPYYPYYLMPELKFSDNKTLHFLKMTQNRPQKIECQRHENGTVLDGGAVRLS